MGHEALCTVRYGGETFSGKALLESSEVLFRGQTRIKIPFSAIKSLQARNGELHIRTADGLTVFDLGEQAEKWHHKIANPKTVLEKLGVKPGESVILEGKFPDDFLQNLKEHAAAAGKRKADSSPPWIFLAAESREGLRRVPKIAKSMRGTTALWIVYPKGQKAITESDVRASGLKAGLTDIKVIAFSATHTALKFVIPRKKR
jgi:hypothetical protein